MPITQLDPAAALIVIDLQKGFAGATTAHPIAEIVARSAQLARAFRKRGFPVVLVNVTAAPQGRTDLGPRNFPRSPDWAELVAELEPRDSDYLLSKQAASAFAGTPLDSYLRERGVTQVFLTGVVTSMGVEATARSARDGGYHTVLVTDAMTDADPGVHRHSVENIFPRLGETGSTEDVLALLKQT